MFDHTFVMSSTDRANQWVEACSKSIGCPAEESASMLATLCGFPTWDVMIHAMSATRPSPCDEQLPKESRKVRHERYVAILTSVFAFDPQYGKYLVQHLSPSSGGPFLPFSMDTQHMHGPRDTSGVNLAEIAEMLGIDDDNEALGEAAKMLLGDIFPEDFDYADLTNSVRALHGVEAWPWFNVFMSQGWRPLDETYNDEPEDGEPAFLLDDQVHGRVPVFLAPFCRTPHDHKDKGADGAMCQALDAYQDGLSEGLYGDSAYLLWSYPLTKEIRGDHYCHLGMILRDGEWKEALVNQHVDSFAKLFRLNAEVTNIDDGHPELIDKEQILFMSINRHMAGMDEPGAPKTGWKTLSTGSFSGWNQVQIYHDDESAA